MGPAPRLLVAAHGTDSAQGSATTRALVDAIRAARPALPTSLCFLDVVEPSLEATLGCTDGPAVVLPLLLSTGYHVQTDIPAVVAGRDDVRVSAHLGPDPLVVEALVDRLEGTATDAASVALVGVGSSRPQARPELERAGQLLAARLDRPVTTMTLFEDVAGLLTTLPGPVAVASYLLAEGHFADLLHAAARDAGVARVAGPIGAHPALVRLVLARYDAALASAG